MHYGRQPGLKMKTLKLFIAASSLAIAGQASATICAAGDPANDCVPPSGAILDLAGQPIPQAYQQYTVSFVASLATTNLTFAFRSDPGFIQLDDVVLTTGAGPNLVVNGGFEGATFPDPATGNAEPVGWVYSNPNHAGANGTVSNNPNSGAHNYADGSVSAYDFLSQSISTIVGDTYDLSFFAYHPGGTPTFQDSGPSTVDLLVYASAAQSSSVPEPESIALLGIGLLASGVAVRRRRR
jgi:hypothetical protein